jgi:hypothetical protein
MVDFNDGFGELDGDPESGVVHGDECGCDRCEAIVDALESTQMVLTVSLDWYLRTLSVRNPDCVCDSCRELIGQGIEYTQSEVFDELPLDVQATFAGTLAEAVASFKEAGGYDEIEEYDDVDE